MYTITEIEKKGLSFLELTSSDGSSSAEICLTQGGRLSQFIFEGIQILSDYDPSTYYKNYASAILFPFVNRIRNGAYTYEDVDYQLNCNEKDKNNALHGLVYNQKFICFNKTSTLDNATVSLLYTHDGDTRGFPFKFNIEVIYILHKNGINLSVKVKNEDKQKFPFSLGWHPYFNSSDLDKSHIDFQSTKRFVLDSQQIITSAKQTNFEMPFSLNAVKLDDGFALNTSEVFFSTPTYNLALASSSRENYLQLYTPDQINSIAIEPMTSAADSFNNKIGLQNLLPDKAFKVDWNLNIETLSKNYKD